MKKIFVNIIVFSLLFTINLLPSVAGGREYIKSKINQVLSDPAFDGSYATVSVQMAKTGEMLYDYNSSYSFAPASNMKIMTTSVALARLGPSFRFDTRIYGGEIINGNVKGDLILYSNGDPTYCVEFYKSPVKVFEAMADKLYSAGVRTIEGDLIADDSFFDRELTGNGWKKAYQFESYSAEISPLSLNENVVDIRVRPGKKKGEAGIVTLFPDAGIIALKNNTTTSSGTENIRVTRQEGTNNITVSGSIPIDYPSMETYITVHEPALYTTSAFARILKSRGISLKGKVRLINPISDGYKKSTYKLLCSHQSPPLTEIISYINKYSDNLSAGMLLKTLGGVIYGYGSTEKGCEVVKSFLNDIHTDSSSLIMADGSGLSPKNRVSGKILLNTLYYMYNSPQRNYFLNSLPVAGVDGTLRKRMRGTSAEGNVRAKTGTISGVSALSGYVTTSYGQSLCFSIIFNEAPGWAAKDGEDRIAQALAACNKKL